MHINHLLCDYLYHNYVLKNIIGLISLNHIIFGIFIII